MSSIWTLPFELFKPDPNQMAGRLREFDIKARTYQAMGKYWAKMFALLKGETNADDLSSKATGYTNDLHADLQKVFSKFKEGEDYNAGNPIENFGERITRQVHKTVLGNESLGNASLKEIQEGLESLWDNFFDCKAGDQKAFDGAMTRFAFDAWVAMDLPAGTAPKFGGGTTATASSAAKSEYTLQGAGEFVYCPVVMEKSKVQAMIPSHMLTLKPTGLDIGDDNHLVIYALARQTITWADGSTLSYQEIFPIIPNVAMAGVPDQLFQAVPVLWVSNVLIARGARDQYKLNKLYADFSEPDKFPINSARNIKKCSNKVTVSEPNDNHTFKQVVAFQADVEATQLPQQLSSTYKSFAPMQKMLEKPMIYWQGNDFYCANYAIDFATSKIEGAKVKLKTSPLYGMDNKSHDVGSIEDDPKGAFLLTYVWKYYLPQPIPAIPG